MRVYNLTPLSTLYNSLILKGLKFNNFLAKNCKPSIYRALEKRVESQVMINKNYILNTFEENVFKSHRRLTDLLSAVAVKPPPLGGGYKATCTL